VEMIQQTVADFLRIKLYDLKSKRRQQHIVFCRHVAMYLCRELTDSSFATIGRLFGRDHSTVIYAYNLIARRVGSDSAFRLSIEKIERACRCGVQARTSACANTEAGFDVLTIGNKPRGN
jgi:chromosomal replication initiator protein